MELSDSDLRQREIAEMLEKIGAEKIAKAQKAIGMDAWLQLREKVKDAEELRSKIEKYNQPSETTR